MNTSEECQNDENQLVERKILKAAHSQAFIDKKEQMRNVPSRIGPNGKVTINYDNLDAIRVLGEGAFGEVVLAVDRVDPSFVAAVKRIGLLGLDNDTGKQVKKEALLQKAVNRHVNVLRYLGMRAKGDLFELYLEYADGGELFDQIEPDVGMESIKAQWYFKQLLHGLQYIHAHGISHRDIKPENLLLNKDHVLKISDFGMATVFRHGDTERILTTRCGTLPYAAPEVLQGRYKGEAIDVWSAGVVLVTMLVGELPWEAPAMDNVQYACFIGKTNYMDRRPWCRMDTTELALIRLILCEDPLKRGDIQRILRHPWVLSELDEHKVKERRKIVEPGLTVRRNPSNRSLKLDGLMATSQPSKMPSIKSIRDRECVTLMNVENQKHQIIHFSQPAHFDLLSQPVSASQIGGYANSPASLVRRMTRFFVVVDVKDALSNIEKAASKLDCEFRPATSHQVFLTPKKFEDLCILVTVYEMIEDNSKKVLVDFRRSKGDGLEFKRLFVEYKKLLQKIICPNSVGWLAKHGLVSLKKANEIVKDSTILPTIDEEEGAPKDVEMDS